MPSGDERAEPTKFWDWIIAHSEVLVKLASWAGAGTAASAIFYFGWGWLNARHTLLGWWWLAIGIAAVAGLLAVTGELFVLRFGLRVTHYVTDIIEGIRWRWSWRDPKAIHWARDHGDVPISEPIPYCPLCGLRLQTTWDAEGQHLNTDLSSFDCPDPGCSFGIELLGALHSGNGRIYAKIERTVENGSWRQVVLVESKGSRRVLKIIAERIEQALKARVGK